MILLIVFYTIKYKYIQRKLFKLTLNSLMEKTFINYLLFSPIIVVFFIGSFGFLSMIAAMEAESQNNNTSNNNTSNSRSW